MRKRAVAVIASMVLAGCGSDDSAGDPGPANAVLRTDSTSLGTIVVDREGMAVYVFDEDDDNTSNCTGACLENWPPVEAPGDGGPVVDGIEGEVGTITRDDGLVQVTLEGRPLYTFARDSDPGEATGQGVEGVWWVVAPDGKAVTDAPAPDYSPSY